MHSNSTLRHVVPQMGMGDSDMKVTNSLDVLEGIPVIEGSRISVEWVFQLLASGYPADTLQHDLELSTEEMQAVFRYGYRILSRFQRVVEDLS